MTARALKPLPPPTMKERQKAREAAQALRAVIAREMPMGEQMTAHIDYSRCRSEWITTWTNLPGFLCANGRFRHVCLPGWEYTKVEVRTEMIPDLEALAERGERPVEATAKGESSR